MNYIISNLPQFLIVLGLIFLAIEGLVLGFSTFVLLFVAVGCIAAGLLMAVGVIPVNIVNALLATAIVSALVALISWKPMKRMQNKVEIAQVQNDMIGHQFSLTEDLALGETVTHRYSGIDWKVKALEPLSKGTEVKIINMQVGLLTVEPVKW